MFYQDPFDVIIIGGHAGTEVSVWPQRVWVNRPAFDTILTRWADMSCNRRSAVLSGKGHW